MSGSLLLDCLRRAAERLGLARPDPGADRAEHAVEQVVARAIPGLRAARGFVSALREPAAATLAFLDALVDELGPPLALDRSSWRNAPYVALLFTTPELARQFFERCEKLRAFFRENAAAECHFLMAMRRKEQTVVGWRLYGEIPRKDEVQCSVTFEEHQVLVAADSYARLREELVLLGLDHLVRIIPARRERDAAFRDSLRHARTLLRAQADALRRQQQEEEPDSAACAALQEKSQMVEEELAANAAELARIEAAPESPAELLRQVREVLLHPDEHVTMQPVTLAVDDFGVKALSPEQAGSRRISFFEITAGNEPPHALLCARLGRDTAEWAWPELRRPAPAGV